MIEAAVISILDGGTYTYLDPDKVYVNRVPQDQSLPYAYMLRISTVPRNSKSNTSHIDQIILRINIISNILLTCENWADEIRTRLDGRVSETVGSVNISQIEFSGKDYLFIDDIDAHIMSLEFTIKENL